MTVIVWDGEKLAADKLAMRDGMAIPVIKICRGSDGSLIGVSGKNSIAREFCEWYDDGRIKADIPKSFIDKDKGGGIALVVTKAREIFVYDCCATPYKIDSHQHAVGAGADPAMAVLSLGHTAREAVEATSKVMVLCGLGIDELSFEEEEK
jgi:hypothetical protein